MPLLWIHNRRKAVPQSMLIHYGVDKKSDNDEAHFARFVNLGCFDLSTFYCNFTVTLC